MAFRKIEAGLVHADVDQFIGKTGTIFYDNSLGDFRISDGQTPGGIALSVSGGDGGNYSLPTATTSVKGGVKIDGSTITIANQVISVGTVPYSSVSGKPTIPTNNNELTNGAAYITSAALSGYATQNYVTTQGYITSSALTGLATETYVTTRGYLTTVAYADVTNKPTLFSGSYADLTNKPTIPTDISQLADASGLLGQGGGGGGTTYITNTVENPFSFSIAGDDSTLREIANGESIKITGAGGITVTTDAEGAVTVTGTPVSLAGYATESYVNSRGYITGLSYNDLTDKPNLAGTYTFNVAADDSTLRTIGTEETVKFVGAGGITTASDAEGAITITQGTTSSLVNGSSTASLGSTGTLALPNNGKIASGVSTAQVGSTTTIALNDQGTDQAYDVTYLGIAWTGNEAVFTTYAAGSTITFANGDVRTINDIQKNELVGFPGEFVIDIYWSASRANLTAFPITLKTANYAAAYTAPEWQFGTDGLLTFPDGTKQSSAPAITIAADDSTQRTVYLGEESIKFIGAGTVTTASDAEGNITITGPSLAGLATETFVTTQGYITGLSYNDLTDKPDLAATYTWSIAADDSTLREILANETVKFIGAGSITTASDAEGNITITGAAPDRLTSNARSAVLNANGTFSLPTLAAEPATPQAGQMALANGTSWDPIAQNNGAPYMVIYTGSAWIGMGGGVTMDQVYMAILELGAAGV